MISQAQFKIRYNDFWPGFIPSDCLFSHVLKSLTGSSIEIVRNPNVKVDLQIDSTFVFKNLKQKTFARGKGIFNRKNYFDYVTKTDFGYRPDSYGLSKKMIWYSGENLRIPAKKYDGFLTFDPNDAGLNNLYLPYWMLRLNWGFPNSEYEITPTPEELTRKRSAWKKERTSCSFSNTGNPTRLRLIDSVRQIYPVDTYGKYFGKPIKSKFETSTKYGFQICSENDLYPGYVTEKIQEAWCARNVPIWTGLFNEDLFNEAAIVNLTSMSREETLETLEKISADQMHYMQELPLLKEKPNLDKITDFFSALI